MTFKIIVQNVFYFIQFGSTIISHAKKLMKMYFSRYSKLLNITFLFLNKHVAPLCIYIMTLDSSLQRTLLPHLILILPYTSVSHQNDVSRTKTNLRERIRLRIRFNFANTLELIFLKSNAIIRSQKSSSENIIILTLKHFNTFSYTGYTNHECS